MLEESKYQHRVRTESGSDRIRKSRQVFWGSSWSGRYRSRFWHRSYAPKSLGL